MESIIKSGVVSEVVMLEDLGEGLHFMQIVIDELDSYHIFHNYAELVVMIGSNVKFSTRKDVYNGLRIQVIVNLSKLEVVQAISELDEIMLEEDDRNFTLVKEVAQEYNVLTFNSDTMKVGDYELAQCILVMDFRHGTSPKAKWLDFRCIDINSKLFTLRYFYHDEHPDNIVNAFAGHYCLADIKKTIYGFQLEGQMVMYQGEIKSGPEIFLSKLKLKAICNRDPDLKAYVEKNDMIEILGNLMYIRPGFHLVEMVAECMLINTICGIMPIYDKDLLYRTVFAYRGYLTAQTTELSRNIINYHKIITSSLKNDSELKRMLDVTGGILEGDYNKAIYFNIRSLVKNILAERRELSEKNPINNFLDSIDDTYAGVFRNTFI